MKISRKLWGIKLTQKSNGHSFLLFGGWHEAMIKSHYKGEPRWAVLFETRIDAREWCKNKNNEYKKHNCDNVVFNVVRIIETIETVTP